MKKNSGMCFNYKNLHLLWNKDNLSKSDKYNEESKELYISDFLKN